MKTMLLMQTMSEGNDGLSFDTMIPFLLMENSSEQDELMLMVLMNSMTGGLESPEGFSQNFNVLLPMLFSTDNAVNGIDQDLLVLLLALQSMSPNTAMGSSSMLPLLFSDETSPNHELIMFMTMLGNQKC